MLGCTLQPAAARTFLTQTLSQVQDLMRIEGQILEDIQKTARTIVTIPRDMYGSGQNLMLRLASANAACNQQARNMLRAALKGQSGELASARQNRAPIY